MKNTVLLYVLKIIAWLPLVVARYLGAVLGNFLRLTNSRPYRVSQINLALCFPQLSESEIDALAKQRMSQL